ncbi:BMC domain-containing protein, partial [Salmonella enterica subsp. enterica serovar Eastbourne]|nr:BMC domain-containing protein [Salmonella enterica subsp. enterica serovar Eastbourne]
VETFSVATCIEAADFAVKAAGVTLIRLHMAYGIGGKCYFVMSGDVADVETAKKAASQVAADKGALVYSMVVPNPHPDFWQQLVAG